jgi:hypothetical protein
MILDEIFLNLIQNPLISKYFNIEKEKGITPVFIIPKEEIIGLINFCELEIKFFTATFKNEGSKIKNKDLSVKFKFRSSHTGKEKLHITFIELVEKLTNIINNIFPPPLPPPYYKEEEIKIEVKDKKKNKLKGCFLM